MKNIVLCLDGTSNQFARDNTNVVKLFQILAKDGEHQAAYYHPGLGTMEPPGALLPVSRRISRVLGLAFGYGLPSDIKDAYVFLMNSYEPGDRVFLFGFSRGAYTARSLASVLHLYGLLDRGNEALVPYVLRMIEGLSARRNRNDSASGFELAGRFKQTFSTRDCKPWFVGVWDTVSSVGWVENPLYLPFTASNPDIEHGRHCVAIDERRAFFRTNLWRPAASGPSGPKDMKQVWFPGSHCDVGGGYGPGETGLSDVTLLWMIEEAEGVGLLVDPARRARLFPAAAVKDPSPAPVHESLAWYWWPAELLLKKHYDWTKRRWGRRMNLGRRRTIPEGSMVHKSAYTRGDAYAALLPLDADIVD